MAALGRAMEVERLADGQEVSDLTQLHGYRAPDAGQASIRSLNGILLTRT
jgi:hypothetical protein